MSEIVSSDPMGLGERRAVFGPQMAAAEVKNGLLGASAAEFAQREAADDLTRRQEKLNLIRLLRDETNSSSVHARCVAIVGEGS